MSIIIKYKSEILSATFATLLTGIVSLSIGMYDLKKTFELSQKKETIYRIRLDLNILKKTDQEIDYNYSFILSENFDINVVKKKININDINETSTSKNKSNFFGQMVTTNELERFQILKAFVPQKKLEISMWPKGGPDITEMNFDIVKEINELYRIFYDINGSIDKICIYTSKDTIGLQYSNNIDRLKSEFKNYKPIIQDVYMKLKPNITLEMKRLKEKYRDLQ